MILPTKGISPQRSLLAVGGTIIALLASPATVSGLWERFLQENKTTDDQQRITFDWFALALTMLFTMGTISWNENGQLERSHVSK